MSAADHQSKGASLFQLGLRYPSAAPIEIWNLILQSHVVGCQVSYHYRLLLEKYILLQVSPFSLSTFQTTLITLGQNLLIVFPRLSPWYILIHLSQPPPLCSIKLPEYEVPIRCHR